MPDLTPVWLSLSLAGITTLLLLLLGTPLAWWLSQTSSRVRPVIEAVTALPLVLPPTVLGFYLLILFMMCAEFVANKGTKELFPESMDIGHQVARHCQALGLIVRPLIHLNVMSPALTLTKDEIDFIVDSLREGIVRTQADLGML